MLARACAAPEQVEDDAVAWGNITGDDVLAEMDGALNPCCPCAVLTRGDAHPFMWYKRVIAITSGVITLILSAVRRSG